MSQDDAIQPKGMLVNNEFIPWDIWLAHLPVAFPPGTEVIALYDHPPREE